MSDFAQRKWFYSCITLAVLAIGAKFAADYNASKAAMAAASRVQAIAANEEPARTRDYSHIAGVLSEISLGLCLVSAASIAGSLFNREPGNPTAAWLALGVASLFQLILV